MTYIEVALKPELPDPAAEGVLAEIRAAGLKAPAAARCVRAYRLDGRLSAVQAERLARELLADPVIEDYAVSGPVRDEADWATIEVWKLPGVMDPVEVSLLKAAGDLGVSLDGAATARKVLLQGALSRDELAEIGRRVLANPVIEQVRLRLAGDPPLRGLPRKAVSPYRFQLITVPLREADDAELLRLSRAGVLSLDLAEMRAIQEHYRAQGRDPTDVELETLAQTWSEHCVHKTLKGRVRFRGPGGEEEVIDNLLASYIARVTRELDREWCLSVFEDNAGVIAFDERYGVAFKVETHNHPSAIEPYGGAGTGIGGVIRDILGTGLGAQPVANTDVFCFGPPDYPFDRLPKGTLHPRRVMRGVVAGVRDYGNRMGIPTLNGAVFFDERYIGNPLVFCGTVGLIPRDKVAKGARPGDRILLIGGRTGRDGIHGATFSSVELTEESETVSSGAVQIGNAITEKKVLDVLLAARDRGLFTAVTDCGAGGLSSAVGEMGARLGAEVNLETVPLKYEGLSYTEIWISEAQERMVLACPPEKVEEMIALCRSESVEATVIGAYTDDKRLRLRYQGRQVADLSLDFLHHGLPRQEREAVWETPTIAEGPLPEKEDLGETLLGLLGALNICSKEWIVRQYDHEVQGRTVIKPLVGKTLDGPGDGAVITPVLGGYRGVAIACGMNPKYGDLAPYRMAASGIDEAVRNAVAVGADPERIALLDNFSWGRTDKPDRLGALVLACRACYDVACAYGTPFISGKDSLNNEYAVGEKTIRIPHTLLISAIGIVPDVRLCTTMDAKRPGSALYVLGLTRDELGGSHYYERHGIPGGAVPGVDAELGRQVFRGVHRLQREKIARSVHDVAEGGIAVAAAEMAFAGGLGATINADDIPADGKLPVRKRLFSESNSRFLIEVSPDRERDFLRLADNLPCGKLGTFTAAPQFVIRDQAAGRQLCALDIAALKAAWQKPLAW